MIFGTWFVFQKLVNERMRCGGFLWGLRLTQSPQHIAQVTRHKGHATSGTDARQE
jgi:hypothetical protein